jgi:tetratricopeptide (TPR) repeat protein
MLELLIIAASFVVLYRQLTMLEAGTSDALAPRQPSPRITQMAEYADRLYAERKWLAAEKAYLAVLKLDHKYTTAYAHLGIIYSTQKNMADAIECFQIAARLRPSGTAFQNLGLAFLDNKNYIKSVAAFEKANMFEPTSARYIGLSKAQLKLSNIPGQIAALEKAKELEPSKRVLELLADAYDDGGRKPEALALKEQIKLGKLSPPASTPKTATEQPNRPVRG